jgi:hypothetical protein
VTKVSEARVESSSQSEASRAPSGELEVSWRCKVIKKTEKDERKRGIFFDENAKIEVLRVKIR